MRFSSFNEVVSWYERTKPMLSKYHEAKHDVRPIGDCKRKWERIKKIDDNTYALLDGNYGRTIWGSTKATEHEYENTMAPITWMRREDGDYIRIRNHRTGHCSVTRYNFLFHYLPTALRFYYNQQGKHWVRHNGEDLILPKCNVRYDHGKKTMEADDNIFLMFGANEDGTFTRVGDKLKVKIQRVDKEVKSEWRPRVAAFYEFCTAIAPMVDKSWGAQQTYHEQIRDWSRANLDPNSNISGWWIRNASHIPEHLMRGVVSNEEHEMRVAVAAMVIKYVGGGAVYGTEDDVRSVKAAYNRLMNKTLGLYRVEEV